MKKRMIKDRILNILTWGASSLYSFILLLILAFIFRTGWSAISGELLCNDYRSRNLMAAFDPAAAGAGIFEKPADLPEGAAFSTKYGFALKDGLSHEKKALLELVYVAPESPLHHASITTAGPDKGKDCGLETGMFLQKLRYNDAAGKTQSAGLIVRQNAAQTVETLDSRAESLSDYYAQTGGGGIRGALYATLDLILLTILMALPLGISAAIYLNELAPKSKLTEILRSSIDVLNGVPSIIFGLMGMTLFFPITALFGVNTQSLLLGAFTMAVILLPTVIRQTEEALRDVPVSQRMASLSLGATRTQTIFRVVLPSAMGGILSAGLLSISRVVGESAALIYTMGASLNEHPGWNKSGSTLAVQIWSLMSGEQPNFELASAISILILIMVLTLNLSVKAITLRLAARQRGGK